MSTEDPARAPLGVRHDHLRRRNRALVIAAVRARRQLSRTDLAAGTGLSASTISAITADLIAEGILREAGGGEAGALRRGRPQVAVALDPRACAVVAVTLALDHLSASAIDYAGEVIEEFSHEIATLCATRAELLDAVAAMARRAVGRAAAHGPALRLVLAVQGITDRTGRAMLWSPITPCADLELADLIERETGVATAIENDCNAIAGALKARDPGRFGENFAAILLSHGIGMGLMLKGEIFSGTRSSGAELGHMVFEPHGALCRCGRHGCIEAYAGDYAIRRHALRESERSPPGSVAPGEIAALAQHARAGDSRAAEAFSRAGAAVGFGLGSLFALVDPAPPVFVGSGTAAFDLMEPALRRALAATAGGAHAESLVFRTEMHEMPLIRAGCAVRALEAVDVEIFAAGTVKTR